MKIRKLSAFLTILLCAALTFSLSTFAKEKEGSKGKTVQKESTVNRDSYRLWINNINLPLNRSGVIAEVQIGTGTNSSGGVYDNQVFLFSGGFFLSGNDTKNSRQFTNAMASASRVTDYLPGPVGKTNDPKAQLYVVSTKDQPFGQSWQEWKDAVEMGAHFYDGDGDGLYNPVDKNGNGKWDPTEDRPDLIGDETVWCIYNDDLASSLRRYNDVVPEGIQIKQTVFALNAKSVIGNIIFVRYEIENAGTVADQLDSVYFSVWADPDLGTPTDDLVGCDSLLNAGYVYNNGPDGLYGPNPPCFLIDFFQGPAEYIPGVTFVDNNSNGVYDDGVDTPLSYAYEVNGKYRGKDSIPGAKNLGISSFVHYLNGDPTIGDPNVQGEARNYQHGKDLKGNSLDPCTWAKSKVVGVDCKLIDTRLWYSGDPVAQVGWINTDPKDQRMMVNTGPFTLRKGKPVSIVAAYVVGRGTSAFNSITVAKDIDIKAQKLFDNNFPSPAPPPTVEYAYQTSDNFLDINMTTSPSFKYEAIDSIQLVKRAVQEIYVTQYRQNTRSATVNGLPNSQIVGDYQLLNFIGDVWAKNNTGGFEKVITAADSSVRLDSLVYSNDNTGRLKLRINSDYFANNNFIKGKEYYFTITTVTVNKWGINKKPGGNSNEFIDSTGAAVEEFESPIFTVVFNDDEYNPAMTPGSVDAKGVVKYLVNDPNKLTGDKYKLSFFKDSTIYTSTYTPYWKLTNETKGTVLADSQKVYNSDTTNYSGLVTDGFLLKISNVAPVLGKAKYSDTNNVWYKPFSSTSGTGVFYVGSDATIGSSVAISSGSLTANTLKSTSITADRLRKVELRFGAPNAGKAYRYLIGYKGSALTKVNSTTFASFITAADTTGKGKVGKLGEGFVDVPFTAWIVDSLEGVEKQLAVGFIEKSPTLALSKGNPDGVWDPGDSLLLSSEQIIIFDAPYDANGAQKLYTGQGLTLANPTTGYDLFKANNVAPADPTLTKYEKKVVNSPWFNALYVVGLQKKDASSTWNSGDKLTIPVTTYPLIAEKSYEFTTNRYENSAQAKKDLFNKINVFPNPLYGYNPATSFNNGSPDEPFVTFSNLPEQVTIKIYNLAGTLVRTLNTSMKSSPTSPFLKWNLQNENGLRIASGMYLATVDCPGFGQKVLKFAIIMPQKQIKKY